MSKYKTIPCLECKGVGLIIKSQDNPCTHCSNKPPFCCHCESNIFRGVYTECTECLGVGKHWIEKITNKRVMVWCLSNDLVK